MGIKPTWLESPDILVFRTCFKFFVGPQEHGENPDFLKTLMGRKLAKIVTPFIKYNF
jgi:hypothetical protein